MRIVVVTHPCYCDIFGVLSQNLPHIISNEEKFRTLMTVRVIVKYRMGTKNGYALGQPDKLFCEPSVG